MTGPNGYRFKVTVQPPLKGSALRLSIDMQAGEKMPRFHYGIELLPLDDARDALTHLASQLTKFLNAHCQIDEESMQRANACMAERRNHEANPEGPQG